eukprot:1156946-Pelagomonas_calceolata.AAC.4
MWRARLSEGRWTVSAQWPAGRGAAESMRGSGDRSCSSLGQEGGTMWAGSRYAGRGRYVTEPVRRQCDACLDSGRRHAAGKVRGQCGAWLGVPGHQPRTSQGEQGMDFQPWEHVPAPLHRGTS